MLYIVRNLWESDVSFLVARTGGAVVENAWGTVGCETARKIKNLGSGVDVVDAFI